MLSNLIKKSKVQKGFTIIEVMIVLAIAGLILVVVLIAIPQLQRNQRNNARQSLATRIVTEINNYSGNNNGNYPIANIASGATNFGTPATALGFFDRYLGCDSAAAIAPALTNASCTTNINDPSTSVPVGVGANGTNVITTTSPVTVAAPSIGAVAGSIGYGTGIVCNGEVPVAGSARNFAFMIRLEGGAVFCLDNK